MPDSNAPTARSRGAYIEEITWPDVEAEMRTVDTVLIPLGAACKEHGHHLPLNTDRLSAEYLAQRIAEQCRVLIAPTVTYGHYPAFLEYPGSASLAFDTFRDLIVDICRSFARQGIRKFYVLNTGISTAKPLGAARQILLSEKVKMEFTDFDSVGSAARASVRQQSLGTHADEIETSMMLYIAPHLVRLELAKPELAPDSPGGLTRNPAGPGVYSPTGSWGDPTLATAEKGRIVTEAIVAEIIEFLVREFGVV
jgi:creatinine amidohydrolase